MNRRNLLKSLAAAASLAVAWRMAPGLELQRGPRVISVSGVMIGQLTDLHAYIEEAMGRPVFTHEMASKSFMAELKAATRDDFVSIEVAR